MSKTQLTRRSFAKLSAAAGAAMAMGVAMRGSFGDVTPAVAAEESARKIFTATCHGCIQACPVRVYVENEVVVKIEGHPMAPTSMGSICLKSMNQMHTCYSPRRILYPIKRAGERGAENAQWERISWDEALDLAGDKISESIRKYGTYSFFTSCGGGGNYSIMHAAYTAQALGSPTFFEPGCAQCWLPRFDVGYAMYGEDDHSISDSSATEPLKGLAKINAEFHGWKVDDGIDVPSDTKMLVCWGAQPTISQTAQAGRGMAELRANGCKMVVVDPNLTPDAAKATVWLRIRPGSDTAMILAWYRYILENELYDEKFTKFFTNLPFLINPDTKMPWLATEVWPDYEPETPPNTPVYVCVDEDTGELAPLPYGYPEDVRKRVNPQVLAFAEVNGASCRTAGEIYWETAEPFTLQRAEELCWVPANLIEKAIRLYTDAEVAGIACGVAVEQQAQSSQAVMGLYGLDMIMGYINKPGSICTKSYYGQGGNVINPPLEPGAKPDRATQSMNGMYGLDNSVYGVGYVIGATEEENAARIAALPEGDFPGSQGALYIVNQLILDRLGTRNHKGLHHWGASHIPSILEAIKTGIPYKPRVWFDMSGNKLGALGNARSWYDAFDEIDFCLCMYPHLTSFQMEVADLVFPVEEWLEYADSSPIPQLNYNFGYFPIIHLGETVSSTVVMVKVLNNASAKLNAAIEAGEEIILGAVGIKAGPAPESPSYTTTATDDELQTSVGSSYIHECDQTKFNLHFPLGFGVPMGCEEDSVHLEALVEQWGAKSWDDLYNNPEKYLGKPQVVDKDEYWTYDNHLREATDGLPYGFATESRKCEVYVTALIRMSQTGWPFAYPRIQEPVDPSIGTELLEQNPDYEFVGMYSPVCQYVEPAESPLQDAPGYDPEYPYVLTSGRVPYFHHGTMRHAAFARELYPTPLVRMHPNTAAAHGLQEHDWVRISSHRGSIVGRVSLNSAFDERVIWMERYWNPERFDSSQDTKDGGWTQMNVNVLTKNTAPFNEVYGSYTNRAFTVKIEKGERPEGVWVEPEEFEPFLPTNASEVYPDMETTVIDSPQTPRIVFNDWRE